MPKKPPASAAAKAETFLLDVHTEPLPARFVEPALRQMQGYVAAWLKAKLGHGDVRTYGTLRHLVLVIEALEMKGLDTFEKFKGPKEQAWKAPDGSFTPAAEGFARK